MGTLILGSAFELFIWFIAYQFGERNCSVFWSSLPMKPSVFIVLFYVVIETVMQMNIHLKSIFSPYCVYILFWVRMCAFHHWWRKKISIAKLYVWMHAFLGTVRVSVVLFTKSTIKWTHCCSKPQTRRQRERKFASFASWVPNLQGVWAPKQPKAMKPKSDPLCNFTMGYSAAIKGSV